jgi:hypothetical protein
MAIDDYVESFGIKIYYGDAAAEPAAIVTEAGGIKDLGDLGGFTGGEKIKVSRINQTDRVNRYAPGMIDPAPLSFTLGCDPANVVTLAALKMVTKGWKVVFNDAPDAGTPTTIHGDGFISEFKVAGKAGDEVTVAVTVQPTGPWTVTAAAGPA